MSVVHFIDIFGDHFTKSYLAFLGDTIKALKMNFYIILTAIVALTVSHAEEVEIGKSVSHWASICGYAGCKIP